MRCLALSEEIIRRGHTSVFVCQVGNGLEWVSDRFRALGVRVLPNPTDPGELPRLFNSLGANIVVFDSYTLPSRTYLETMALGVTTMAFVDGVLRGAWADILLDQNYGAESDLSVSPRTVHLAGTNYAVLSDDVIRHRPSSPPIVTESRTPKVLAFFGGTDTLGASPVIVQALAETGCPFEAIVIVPNVDLRRRVQDVVLARGQRVETISPTNRLPELVRSADLVICSAGTSMWEGFALGATVGAVCLVDNQDLAYDRVTKSGAAAAVGRLPQIQNDVRSAVHELRRLLVDAETRHHLAQAAWRMIDGKGKVRVVDALEQQAGRRF